MFNAMRASSTESTIQWREFVAAGLCHCKVDERNLKLTFDRLDSDHTGFITFDNVMDLIGNCAEHSEAALRGMWEECSINSSEARITYEDFLPLMNGMMKPKAPVVEGGYMAPSSFTPEEDLSDGPVCMDDEGDNEVLNQGFAQTMQHEGSGLIIKASPTGPANQESLPDKSKDKVTNYRAHRSMRHAVLEASTRLEEEQQRRAREEMRKEQAKLNTSAGLIMRRGGELSADAIERFVNQKKKEEQEKVQKATKRTGRNHSRKKTSSDIRGMFEGPNSAAGNLSSSQRFVSKRGRSGSQKTIQALPSRKQAAVKQRPLPLVGGPSSRRSTSKTIQTLPTMGEHTAVSGAHNEQPPLQPKGLSSSQRVISKRGRLGSQTQTLPKLGEHAAVSRPDIPDLPIGRNATKPGQFRKTNYDPFSFKATKELEGGGHLDLSVRYRSRRAVLNK